MDDVKSNGVDDGELKLRGAGLEFRGSKKEDSEVLVKVGSWVVMLEAVVSERAKLNGSHDGDCLVCVCNGDGVDGRENQAARGVGDLNKAEARAAPERADDL